MSNGDTTPAPDTATPPPDSLPEVTVSAQRPQLSDMDSSSLREQLISKVVKSALTADAQEPQAQALEKAAQEHMKRSEEMAQRQADIAEQQAAWMKEVGPEMAAYVEKTPNRQGIYAANLHMAPLLSILSAVGGKMTRASGLQMLAAQTGMVQGLNQGSEQAYQAAREQWQTGFDNFQKQVKMQEQYYNLMLKAYGGRADAEEKAALASERMSGNIRSEAQKKLASGVQALGLDQKAVMQMMQIKNAELGLELKRQQLAVQQQNQMTPDARLVAAFRVAVNGEQLNQVVPYTRGGTDRTQVANLIAFAQQHKDDPAFQSAREAADSATNSAVAYAGQKRATLGAAAMAGTIEGASLSLEQSLPQARALASKVGRKYGWQPMNKLAQDLNLQMNDPDVAQLVALNNTVRNDYNVVGGRGGKALEDRKRNMDNLDSARDLDTYLAQLNVVDAETAITRRGYSQAMHREHYLPQNMPPTPPLLTTPGAWGPQGQTQPPGAAAPPPAAGGAQGEQSPRGPMQNPGYPSRDERGRVLQHSQSQGYVYVNPNDPSDWVAAPAAPGRQ